MPSAYSRKETGSASAAGSSRRTPSWLCKRHSCSAWATMGSVSNNFDYFVYIYPTFNHVGKYGESTEAYETEVNVRVYDMNKKEKYESGVIATVPAPDEYRYSGSPASRYWPNIDKEAAIDYIATLV